MKRSASVIAVLLLAASVALAPVALAQPPSVAGKAATPKATVIDVTKACGRVTLTLTGPDDGISGTHGFRWNAVSGAVATDVGARTGTVTVADDDVKKLNIDFPEDEFGGVAAVTVAVFFGPNSHLQLPLDIYPVDTDCTGVAATATTNPPAPTTTVAPPTTTPKASPTATPPPVRYDNCAAAGAAGAAPIPTGAPGYRAGLDADSDGTACEDATDGVLSQLDAIPVGGVATGDGSTL